MNSDQALVFQEIAKIAQLLKWFGDPVLRIECNEISADELKKRSIQELAQNLINVLANIREITGLGRGLAAPQIGVSKRVIIIYIDEEYKVLVNPKIIQRSDELGVYPEMCLSSLPVTANVIRPWQVEVQYQDLDGKSHKLLAEPMLSRLLQHEIDHLNGVLFTDKADIKTISIVKNFESYKTHAELVRI